MPPKLSTLESPKGKSELSGAQTETPERSFYHDYRGVRVTGTTVPLGKEAPIIREAIPDPDAVKPEADNVIPLNPKEPEALQQKSEESPQWFHPDELSKNIKNEDPGRTERERENEARDIEQFGFPRAILGKERNAPDNLLGGFPREILNTKEVPIPANDNEVLPEDRIEYLAARSVWENARNESDALETEFRSKYKEFITHEENRKLAGLRRWLSIEPKLSEELEALRERSIRARASYKDAAVKLKDAKSSKEVPGTAELGPKPREALVIERYQRMLAQKLVLSPIEERRAIQEKVVGELHPQRSKLIEWAKKTRGARIGGTVALYSLIGLATGGVGVALLAGGTRAGSFFLGMKGGALAGSGTRELLNQMYVRKKEEGYQAATGDAKKNLFESDFNTLEEEVSGKHLSLRRAERNTRVASAGAAFAGGALAGGGVMNAAHEALDTAADAVTITRETPPQGSDEVVPGEFLDTEVYTVQGGDNLWNILEGDVAGRDMSESLKAVPEGERNAALTELFKRVDSDPALREAIGMKSSSANVIQAGENLNIEVLEDVLRDISNEKGWTAETASEVTTEKPAAVSTFTYEPVGPTDDKEANEDPESITLPPEKIDERIQKLIKGVETNRSGLFKFLDGPNIEGTYDAMKRMKLFEVISLQGDPDALDRKLQSLGIREQGWDKWVDAINAHNDRLPFERDETLEHYLERLAKADLPPKDVE